MILLLPFFKPCNRYKGKWPTSKTFKQTTERFRNDSLVSTTTWYESMQFPDLLRIDIGKINSENAIIFRKDSTYNIRNSKTTRATKNENELIFFLGGMYFVSFDEVLAHFKALHYDLSKFHKSSWQGKPVYVIGADTDREEVNQLWFDEEKMIPVRFLKFENNSKQEGTFEKHIALKKGWSETYCRFIVNGKLLQAETYTDIIADPVIDPSIFLPPM